MPKTAEEATSSTEAADVGRRYFEALAARDVDAMIGCWAEGGVERIAPVGELRAKAEVRAFFEELQGAVPDARTEVLDLVGEGNRVAVRWRMTGTFAGAPFQGIEPNASRIDIEGLDLLTVEDGLIQRNDAYYDGATFARQIGLLPSRESRGERGMTAAFNVRTRLLGKLSAPSVEPVADGVWLVRGDIKKAMNVYLIEDEGGVTVFDAGTRAMTRGIAAAAATMGGIKRVVLGHSHADHRGAAPGLGAPVYCHPDELADAEGDGGLHYFDFSHLARFKPGALIFPRYVMPFLLRRWDGGPVEIAGTVAEGEEIAGFTVVHCPGHAPGLIALWRESDRLALVSDTFYTTDPETGHPGPPRVPARSYNLDTEQARASIRKLAAMEPAAAWPGHANPLTGDVRTQLEHAAETT